MKLTEIIIACFNLEDMVLFYHNVFDIYVKEVQIPKGKIYEGQIDDLKIIFCAASIAGITAKDNRHQLTFQIDDVKSSIEKIKQFGGSLMNELQKADNCLQIAIRDVDGNSIILMERS